MAIFAIGAFHNKDVSDYFIKNKIAGPGWSIAEAPELHQFVNSLKVGDIVYIKSASPKSKNITVKAIGIIADDKLVMNSQVVRIGRNINWIITKSFTILKPIEKNNVRMNTMYEEFHPVIQNSILKTLFSY